MSDFEVQLRAWLKNQGFDCDVMFEDDFGYDFADNVLHIGIVEYPVVGRWFEQFQYEYGLEWCGIYDSVMVLIHELGHYATLKCFDDTTLLSCQVIKMFDTENRMDDMGAMFKYWEVTDEFEANMWAVDFINWNFEAVENLIAIWEGAQK